VTTLTIKFEGIPKEVLEEAVKRGYGKTKSEVLRAALIQFGQDMDLIKPKLHSKTEAYAYSEINKRTK